MAARFFLGVFEAGYGPGIPYLLFLLLSAPRDRAANRYLLVCSAAGNMLCRRTGLRHHVWEPVYRELENLVPRRGPALHHHGRRGMVLNARQARQSAVPHS